MKMKETGEFGTIYTEFQNKPKPISGKWQP